MSLQLHRPDGEGGLEPQAGSDRNWRGQLRSPRWGSGRRSHQLPELRNTEMNPTDRFRSVLFWLGLGVATFAIIVLGYGTKFWG